MTQKFFIQLSGTVYFLTAFFVSAFLAPPLTSCLVCLLTPWASYSITFVKIYYSSLQDHSSESFEVGASSSLGDGSSSGGRLGGVPLFDQLGFVDGLGQRLGWGVSFNGNLEFSEGESLDGDKLSGDSGGGTVDEDLASLKIVKIWILCFRSRCQWWRRAFLCQHRSGYIQLFRFRRSFRKSR